MSTNLLGHARKYWREQGYIVEAGESIVKLPGGITRRHDLFGFVDLVCVAARSFPDTSLIFVQVTSWANVHKRLKKIHTETFGTGQWTTPIRDAVMALQQAHVQCCVQGWRRGKNGHWEHKEEWL
jgi:hypothetical protein